ncbi:MAG: hypothetical protein ACI91O_001624 [Candidatus Poriferisodalaceae bacterium]
MSAWSGGVDEEGSEALDPLVDGDVVYLDPTFDEEFFDVAVGESVAEVPAHGEHDDLGWKAVASER